MPISESELVDVLQASMPAIGAMCMRRLQTIQSRFDVEDLQQVVAIKALRSRSQLKSDDPKIAGHWVRKIAANACKTAVAHELTASRNITKTITIDPPHAVGLEEEDFAEDLEQIESALKQIPVRQAEALRLRFFELLDNSGVAARMGVNAGVARTLVSRGLDAVRAIVHK